MRRAWSLAKAQAVEIVETRHAQVHKLGEGAC
jgi:hypothetical protein